MLWNIGFIAGYIFVLYTLYQCFNDTAFTVKYIIIYLHVCIIITCLILGVVSTIFSNINQHILGSISTVTGTCLYVTGIIHVCYQFNHRLLLIIKAQSKYGQNTGSTESVSATSISTDNEKQKTLLRTIVKVTVLLTVFSLIMFVYIIFTILHFVLWPKSIMMGIVYWILYIICVIDGTATVYLVFAMNSKEYYFLCGRLDNCVKLWYLSHPTEIAMVEIQSASPTGDTKCKSNANKED